MVFDVAVKPALRFMAQYGRVPAFASPQAAALLLAIAATESDCLARRQHGGPALSWWQIEPPTFLDLAANGPFVPLFLGLLGVWPLMRDEPGGLAFDQVAACVVARLLLYRRVRRALPLLSADEADEACGQYFDAWRPGAPRPQDFKAAWPEAVSVVQELW